MIRIISNGTGFATRVLNTNGEEINGVTKIEIEPITANGQVTATLTFENVELEIKAEDVTPAFVPWGEWVADGYWFPNRMLEMTAREQYNANFKNGYEMKLHGFLQREIFDTEVGDNDK